MLTTTRAPFPTNHEEPVKPLQTLGLFGARDFDKYVFKIPFPLYDGRNDAHIRLANLVEEAEEVAARVDISGVRRFQDARKLVDQALDACALTKRLEDAVEVILPIVDPAALEE